LAPESPLEMAQIPARSSAEGGHVRVVSILALAFWKETPMHRTSLAHLALFALLTLATACGGAQSHAESPSAPPADTSGASSGSDGSAQLPESAIKTEDQKPMQKPETSSAAEDAIVSGNALPPSPGSVNAPKAPKATKAKKPAKAPKKTAQATRG
jgi:hypothetical protein